VALGRPELVSEEPATEGDVASPSPSAEPAPAPASPARIRWAILLARIYDVLPLLCPACGSEMKILAFLTDPPVVSAILLHLDLPHKPPPLSPARGPPQSDLLTGLLDQTPAFDPAEPDPVPDQRFASVPSSSTSPCPTNSTSEAPESGRPGGLLSAPPRPSAHLGGPFRVAELSRLARPTLAPASARVSASPPLCLGTPCPVPPPCPPRNALRTCYPFLRHVAAERPRLNFLLLGRLLTGLGAACIIDRR